MSDILDFLRQRLAPGEWRLGQLLARSDFTLRHADDGDFSALETFTRPEAARELAKFDASGNYRPLKTAPNLKGGWLLRLSSLEEARLALDFFYPAALGTRLAHERGELAVVPLRETLERQTGMYRVARRISGEQVRAVIEKTCAEGCIRHRLWNLSTGDQSPIASHAVLCAEGCNLLVAACRAAVKSSSLGEGGIPAEP